MAKIKKNLAKAKAKAKVEIKKEKKALRKQRRILKKLGSLEES